MKLLKVICTKCDQTMVLTDDLISYCAASINATPTVPIYKCIKCGYIENMKTLIETGQPAYS